MGGVAVVTDSTADLPAELVESLGLRVVPLSVTFGDESLIAGVTLTTDEFYQRLRDTERIPTTSQPAPVWFEEAYADCVDEGYERIVSIHCSSALSGTVALARDRGARMPISVEVVDSRLVGGALGLAALAAHRVAEAGGSVEAVVAAADRIRRAARSLIVVDSLDHLRRGGRVTGAQATFGTAMRIKPLLQLTDEGRVEILERTRTWGRALDRVAELAAETAGGRAVEAVVVHAVAPERAQELAERLAARVSLAVEHRALIGPIVGTHVGPGAVGVALVPTG